ncbi:glycosyltransferase family 25 protein [Nemania sp. FL0916]|nr:glycosyltransferase family 25 protein [Nemania sp. FL0916]
MKNIRSFKSPYIYQVNSSQGYPDAYLRKLCYNLTLSPHNSNLSLTFLNGIKIETAPPSSSSSPGDHSPAGTSTRSHRGSAGALGSWQSHLGAVQAIVDKGLDSALVLEDDVDWDVRLRAQMRTFAMAARTWLYLKDQGRDNDTISLLLDNPASGVDNNDDNNKSMGSARIYGDGWDVLWLGHCGAALPPTRDEQQQQQQQQDSNGPILPPSPPSSSSPLKITIPNDPTVPAQQHLKPHPFALRDALADVYPEHTRVVHGVHANTCSLAYAVSRAGAEKLLARFRADGFKAQWDIMLREYCMGQRSVSVVDRDETMNRDEYGEREREREEKGEGEEGKGQEGLVCLTVQPPLISHHFADAGGGGASVSDIRGQAGGFAGAKTKAGSPYLRLSVQANLKRLLEEPGSSLDGLVDQLPDDGDPLW